MSAKVIGRDNRQVVRCRRVSAFNLALLSFAFIGQQIKYVSTVSPEKSGNLSASSSRWHSAASTGLDERKQEDSQIANVPQKVDQANSNNQDSSSRQPRFVLAWKHLKLTVRNTFAPAREYLDLISRYHGWYKQYSALERTSSGAIKPATIVMRDEYARVNELLMAEACPLDKTEIDNENMDFVFRALKVVITDLENILHELKAENERLNMREEEDVFYDAVDGEEDEENEKRVKKAMDYVRKAAINTAKNVALNESVVLAKMVAVNTASSYLTAFATESLLDPLSYLAPLIAMMSTGNANLAVVYLRDLELRAALNIIERLNPIAKLKCLGDKTKDKTKRE